MIVNLTNFLNHHQAPLAEELYALTDGEYRLATFETVPGERRAMGYADSFGYAWHIDVAAGGQKALDEVVRLVGEADVVMFGGVLPKPVAAALRRRALDGGLCLEIGERWLKKGLLNVLSPRLQRWWIDYQRFYRRGAVYRLCSSAYAADDMRVLGAYPRRRCFKWGYFTAVPEFDAEGSWRQRMADPVCRIIWCGRFLGWKHPEKMLVLARTIRDRGLHAVIDMYGDGALMHDLRSRVESERLGDILRLHGNRLNAEIVHEMRCHHIFVHTADRNEGWGAVINEAMGTACAVVADRSVGAVPYLVSDGVSGFCFSSEKEFEDKTLRLIADRALCRDMGLNAYAVMQRCWTPRAAAEALLRLIADLQAHRTVSIAEGPGSQA